jgi:NAD(P)H-hydrate epimerase
MQTYDDITCNNENITSFELMTRAANALKKQFVKDFKQTVNNILIVAGLGNNGGDGIMMGHFLKKSGYHITILCVGDRASMRSETKDALEHVKAVQFIETEDDLTHLRAAMKQTDMIIDALFGLGLTRDISGIYHNVISIINNHTTPILSIDFPSGIDPYTGLVRGVAVKASYTYVIQSYKYGNLLTDALDHHGHTTTIDIGIAIEKVEGHLLDHTPIIPKVMHRTHNTHKYEYGSVLIVGGSKTMMGAPNLSALAALRSGAGLVTIAYDEATFKYRVMPNMEIMHTEYKAGEITTVLNKTTAIAFGMGLGKDNANHKTTLTSLLETSIPLVIDADGLSYYGQIKDSVTFNKPVVLTPHLGELLSLLDIDKDTFYHAWVDHLRTFVKRYHVTLVLKGPVSIIVTKDHMAFSTYGNPALATAGSGDVLTGIIASRLAQTHDDKHAVEEGLVLHGLSGDTALKNTNSMSVIASDLIQALTQLTG